MTFPNLPTMYLDNSNSTSSDMLLDRVLKNVTELRAEIASPEDAANTSAASLQDLCDLSQRALQEQKAESVVKIFLPDKHYAGPEYAYCFDSFIQLPNLKIAILPPFNHWPLSFTAPNLESLTFTAQDRRDRPNREYIGPPLISTAWQFLANQDRLSKLKHLGIVCCSGDPLAATDHWFRYMNNLKSLSVKCIHSHTELDSQLIDDNMVFWQLVTGLVDVLGFYTDWNPNLETVSMDGMLFKPGELVKMVEEREKDGVP